MSRMRLSLLIGLMAMLAAPALADLDKMSSPPPATDKLVAAKQLVDITKADESIGQLIPIMANTYANVIARDNPDQKDKIKGIVEKTYIPALSSHLPEIHKKIVAIYADNFSLDELNQLLVFYRSPVGTKYINSRPTVMTETMKTTKAWAHSTVEEANVKLMDELKKNNLKIPSEVEKGMP